MYDISTNICILTNAITITNFGLNIKKILGTYTYLFVGLILGPDFDC